MAWNDSASLPFEPPEQENIRLREEIARLQRLLAAHGIPIPQTALEKPAPVKAVESATVALSRSLFRGRDDVYAQRWESVDGRSGYGQTAAPPYAVRALDSAPVAAPLRWDEVDNPRLRPDQFNIRNIFDRLDRVGDPWKETRKHVQAIPA